MEIEKKVLFLFPRNSSPLAKGCVWYCSSISNTIPNTEIKQIHKVSKYCKFVLKTFLQSRITLASALMIAVEDLCFSISHALIKQSAL